MRWERYVECLGADAARLRDVAERDLTARVPSCPDWDTAELVRHTGLVYLHKVNAMRTGAGEGPWPPPGTESEEPLALFDRAYKELIAEFDAREPSEKTPTWYDDDHTVGFWIRRMAQETVIHRVDAELAQSESLAPIPEDLAVDGIDEVLVAFLSFASVKWHSEFPGLEACDGRTVAIRADGSAWGARLTPEGVIVSAGVDSAAATISGRPDDVLLWLWRRADDGVITTSGDATLVAKLRELLGVATQ